MPMFCDIDKAFDPESLSLCKVSFHRSVLPTLPWEFRSCMGCDMWATELMPGPCAESMDTGMRRDLTQGMVVTRESVVAAEASHGISRSMIR